MQSVLSGPPSGGRTVSGEPEPSSPRSLFCRKHLGSQLAVHQRRSGLLLNMGGQRLGGLVDRYRISPRIPERSGGTPDPLVEIVSADDGTRRAKVPFYLLQVRQDGEGRMRVARCRGGARQVIPDVDVGEIGVQLGDDSLRGRLLLDHLVVKALVETVISTRLLILVVSLAGRHEPLKPLTCPDALLLRPLNHCLSFDSNVRAEMTIRRFRPATLGGET